MLASYLVCQLRKINYYQLVSSLFSIILNCKTFVIEANNFKHDHNKLIIGLSDAINTLVNQPDSREKLLVLMSKNIAKILRNF